MKLTQEEKRIKIAEVCGWRRWKFGDPWVKGLQLSDARFGGYVRRVIADSDPSSSTVKLDIDEAWTQNVSYVVVNYTPKSHWVSSSGEIRKNPPDYFNDLSACYKLENTLSDDQHADFREQLAKLVGFNGLNMQGARAYISSTAAQRAEAFGLTLNLWEA